MKTRQLLRFYFYAEGVEDAINNLITYVGCSSFCTFGAKGAEGAADKIIYLRDCKDSLSELWNFLNGVISRFGADQKVLQSYACGSGDYSETVQKRVLMRFRRRAYGVQRFAAALSLLRKYAAFCHPDGFYRNIAFPASGEGVNPELNRGVDG